MHGYPTKVLVMNRGDHFRFASVFIKKITKLNLKKKLKPNRNRFKPNGFSSVFLDKNRFKLVGLVWLGFFSFGSVFSCLTQVFSVWVQFGFFSFRLIKPNRTVWFFIILLGLIWFFSRFSFFGYFFLIFSV